MPLRPPVALRSLTVLALGGALFAGHVAFATDAGGSGPIAATARAGLADGCSFEAVPAGTARTSPTARMARACD